MKLKPSNKRGCGYWLRLLSMGLVSGILLYAIGYEVLYIKEMVSPARHTPCCITPAELGLVYEPVVLTSWDGVKLSGWYIPSRNRAAVILLHGYGNDRAMMLHQAEIMARHGYGVLLYDLRAHGESEGDQRTFGWQDVDDVPAAVAFLQNRSEVDSKRIGIHGFSIGATIAIQAAARSKAIRAVLAEEPGPVTLKDAPPPTSMADAIIYAVYFVDYKGVELFTGIPAPSSIVDVIGTISPRALFLISTGQEQGSRGTRFYYERAQEPKRLWEVPETEHGGSLRARPAEYEQNIMGFFDEALLND
ncbi:MAG: alpha/beta hydrolase [Acidobacteriota bacterium]